MKKQTELQAATRMYRIVKNIPDNENFMSAKCYEKPVIANIIDTLAINFSYGKST